MAEQQAGHCYRGRVYTPQSDLSTETDSPIGLTDLGRVRVLRALAEHRQLSRSEIVGRTGLARATVSSIVYELINGNLVREDAAADVGGPRTGRPAQVLSLVPDSAYALGLDIAHDHVRAILTDIVGTILWDRTQPMAVDDDPERALDTAVQLIGSALADVGVAREKVLGLGAGFACPVDRDRRRLRAEGIMPGWVGVQAVDELAGRTGLPVQIINDANAGVLAERRFGAARGCDNVVYLRLSAGIGAGAICDGRILLGHGGIAGELGHFVIDPRGTLCRCGNRGCLETVASPPAIADLLTRSWGRDIGTADLPGLLSAADRGAVRAVEDAGDAVGRALAAAVLMLNPEMIVVGGELAAARETLFEPMRRAIDRNTMVCHGESLRIVPSELGDSAGVRGAAALVLEGAPEALALAPAS
jgi:predicted NBD/HSP70 family sugar kinase